MCVGLKFQLNMLFPNNTYMYKLCNMYLQCKHSLYRELFIVL